MIEARIIGDVKAWPSATNPIMEKGHGKMRVEVRPSVFEMRRFEDRCEKEKVRDAVTGQTRWAMVHKGFSFDGWKTIGRNLPEAWQAAQKAGNH